MLIANLFDFECKKKKLSIAQLTFLKNVSVILMKIKF